MGRAVGVVIVGWTSGFLLAIAWGATRVSNARLASSLLAVAIAAVVLTAVLLVINAVRGRAARRRPSPMIEPQADGTAVIGATAVSVFEQRAAARIAELEARLALEEAELDAAVASLAAAELASTDDMGQDPADAGADTEAAALEPVLRQQVLDTVAELVGHTAAGAETELAGHLKELGEKAH